MRDQEIRRSGRARRGRRGSRVRRPSPTLAIVVQGGTVQGVYADRRGRCTVYLLDYDDLVGVLGEPIRGTRALPEIGVASGLSRAVAEYRGVATKTARRRPAAGPETDGARPGERVRATP